MGATAPTPERQPIPVVPMGTEKPLQNRPDDSDLTGTLKNAGTTGIKGLAHIPGFAGDLSDLAKYVMARIHSGITGAPVEELQRREQEFERRKADFGRRNLGFSIPSVPSGQDIAAPILEKTGEYQPTTSIGRLGAAAGETGLSMLGPGAIGGGLRAAAAGQRGLSVIPGVIKGGASAVPGGAAAGVAGDAATQYTGDPLAGILATMAVPAAAKVAKPTVREVAAPFVPSMRPAAANRILTKSAADPGKALDTLAQRPAKPGETLGEATLDSGVLQAEKGMLNTSDHFKAAMHERDVTRNEQRKTTIEGVAPSADAMAPVRLFRERLRDIDRATQETVDRATAQAKAAHEAIPGAKPYEQIGETQRNILAEADKVRGAAVSRLYNAIDPNGALHLVTSDLRDAGLAMHNAFDPMVSKPNTATPIIAMVKNLPDVMPFKKLEMLDKTITAEMKKASLAGDGIGHNELVELKGHVQSAIDNAIENQHKWEQRAVERGDMRAEDTIGSRLADEAQQFSAERKAGRSVVARAGNDGTTGATSVSRPSGGQGEAGGQSGIPPGAEGIPGNVPNMDAEAAGRLTAAKEAHKERARAKAPVAPILKTTGFAEQYVMPAAKVPAAAFAKGDAGYTTAQAFMKATNDHPDALASLHDVASSRLQDAMPEGVLTPKALAKWKQDYGPALRAIDERVPGFSDRFSNAASATDALEQSALNRKTALAEAQKGTAAKFMNLTNPNEVGDTLMGMVKARNGPTQVADAIGRMDPEAQAGARHALTQTILRDHQNADGSMSGAKLRNFITDNQSSLEAAYGKNGADVLGKLAEDAERYQKASGMQRSKLGSDSFSNMIRWAREHGTGHITDMSLGFAIYNGAMEAIAHHDPGQIIAATGLAAAKIALSKLRANGVHKISDLVERGMTEPEVGAAMMRSALDGKGNLDVSALTALADAVAKGAAANKTLQDHARIGRASGGKVAVDHAEMARKLIGLADKAKKNHAQKTQRLLKVPDANIASALRLANEATR